MDFKILKVKEISRLPKRSGVYSFQKASGDILYIGKAANLRERVRNHFIQPGFKENKFLAKTKKVGFLQTDSEIEALILEANLIKKLQPKYNIVWRDDKNYFFVGVTKEDFPRVFLTHQKKIKTKHHKLKASYLGPFIDGKSLKTVLKALRKVFPYRSCRTLPKRSCLWHQLKRCPAPCLLKGKLTKQIPTAQIRLARECQLNAEKLLKILRGRKVQVLKDLKKEMKTASSAQKFERAAKIRDQIWALERILSHARVLEEESVFPKSNWQEIQKILGKIIKTKKTISRVEAYDISNIQGKKATGSMVTFIKGKPAKDFYRKFKIKIEEKPNDIAMMKETLIRRLKHSEWPYPQLILIDGGKTQLNTALKTINQYKAVKSASIGVMALAKKKNKLYIEGRKNPLLLKNLPREVFNLILQLRDEAHRFAIAYHRKLREMEFRST